MLLMAFSFATVSVAQNVQWYKTSQVSVRAKNANGVWGSWSDWQSCVVNIKFDLSNDVIWIFSSKTQKYIVTETLDPPYDATGRQVMFKAIDQDGDICHIRLRIENNGNSQLYVDFSNVSWVYNVRRTS